MCKITKHEMKTKRKWQVLIILSILWSLLLAACSADERSGKPGEAGTFEGTQIPVGDSSSDSGIVDAADPITAGESDSIVNPSRDDISLDDCPAYVFPAGEGQLLLVGEGLTLLDCNTLEIVAQNRDVGLDFNLGDLSSCRLTVLEKEYILLGNWIDLGEAQALGNGTFFSVSSEEPEFKMIRIGKDLQVMEAVTMNGIIGAEREISAFVLAEQGTKLIFAEEYHGLYVYDRNTKERSTCIEFYNSLNGTESGGISLISSIQYVESTGQICFTGSYYNSEKKDFLRTVGQVNMDGSGLSYEKEGVNAYGDLWCFDGFALIEDMEFREHGIGTAFYYDRNKERYVYSLADEYTGLQPSQEGNYFAVQSVAWSEDGRNIGYIVRIYASKSGQLLQEISLPRTEIGENTVLSDCVVCEDTGRILLLLHERGTNENAHIKVINLSMQQ